MTPSDFRRDTTAGYSFPAAIWGTTPAMADLSGSQRLSRRVPRSTTPDGRIAARACCFTMRAGFTTYCRMATVKFTFRGRISFTYVTVRDFAAPGFGFGSYPPPRRIGYMCNKQFTWLAPCIQRETSSLA